MKYIPTLLLLLITIPAHADLYVDFYLNKYSIRGNVSAGKYLVYMESRNSIKYGSRINWPTKDGVWAFPTYKRIHDAYSIDPIYLAPPLIVTPSYVQNADVYLNILSIDQLFRGIDLPNIDTTALEEVGLHICDYKVNTSPWKCKGAKAGSGLIETPTPPQPPLSCSISGSIELRHGNITLSNVANNRAVTTAYVTCNRAANVSVAIAQNMAGRVKLNGVEGLYSVLSVEGVGSGRSYRFSAGTGYRSLTFASVLETNGNTSAGDFSGSASVVLTFP
ncbi:PapG chaperone-binding domain-containing protein [Pseudomonas sp. M5A4_2d]|nr:hypothetical protein [Pseudomonas sp. ERGC3:01]